METLDGNLITIRILERQLAAARKLNTVLFNEIAKQHAMLSWYQGKWPYRLDRWLRRMRQPLTDLGWRLHDAWEVLNGRYSN